MEEKIKTASESTKSRGKKKKSGADRNRLLTLSIASKQKVEKLKIGKKLQTEKR